jgi:replicative DNA helicase
MHARKVPVSSENVWAESGRQINLDFLHELEGEAVIDETEMTLAAKRIVSYSDRAQKLKIAQNTVAALMDETRDIYEASSQAIRGLSQTRAAEIQDAQIGSIIERQRSGRGVHIFTTPTGFAWLDEQMKGGLRSGRYVVLAGREKGRKTSVIRNIMLQACQYPVGGGRTGLGVSTDRGPPSSTRIDTATR